MEEDFNKETTIKVQKVPIVGLDQKTRLPFTVEAISAALFVGLIASVPLLLASNTKESLTKIHYVESVALLLWLGGAIWLFTSVIMFSSVHFELTRCLTIVEAVYLLAQVITTVGYGDITPAYPRGQVCLAFYVLAALLLYGGLMMELSQVLVERAEESAAYFQERASTLGHEVAGHLKAVTGSSSATDADELQQASAAAEAASADGPKETPKGTLFKRQHAISYKPLMKSATLFTMIAGIGVLFWHYYPGEGKTWLEAIYMSIITLSTVGFGALTATTEAGKVFGAFWMIFGVTAMGSVIGCAVELVLGHKLMERSKTKEAQERYHQLVKGCSAKEGMSRYDFLKCELLYSNLLSEEALGEIEEKFDSLNPTATGLLSARKILGHTPQATPR